MIDDKQLTTVDGNGCESVSEVEVITTTTAKTARLMAKALGCEVIEEKHSLYLAVSQRGNT